MAIDWNKYSQKTTTTSKINWDKFSNTKPQEVKKTVSAGPRIDLTPQGIFPGIKVKTGVGPVKQTLEIPKPKPKKEVKIGEGTLKAAPQKEEHGWLGNIAFAAYNTVKEVLDSSAKTLDNMVSKMGEYNLNDYQNIANERGKQIQKLSPTDEKYKTGQRFIAPTETFDQTAEKLGIKKTTTLQRGVAMGQGAMTAVNIGFLPITTQLEAAKELPGPLSLPAKGVSFLLGKISDLGSYAMGKGVDVLPISQEAKDEIKPLAQEIGSLTTMALGMKYIHTAGKKGLELKGLPFKEGTKAKISKGAQITAAFSMTPFSSAYSMISGRIASKVQERQDKGIEVTPEEGRKIVEEVKQELPPEVIKEAEIAKKELPIKQKVEIKPAEKATSPEIKPAKQITPETKTSGVAKSVETKSTEQKLTESFGELAEYTPIKVKEQAEKIDNLINTDIEKARRVIRGEESLPEGILGGTMIKGMEDYALKTRNAELIKEIANSPLTSETSVHAQELRMLAEREPDSAVIKIREIKKMREEAALKKTKSKNLKAEKEGIVSEIKDKIKEQKKTLAKKETWVDFVNSITC